MVSNAEPFPPVNAAAAAAAATLLPAAVARFPTGVCCACRGMLDADGAVGHGFPSVLYAPLLLPLLLMASLVRVGHSASGGGHCGGRRQRLMLLLLLMLMLLLLLLLLLLDAAAGVAIQAFGQPIMKGREGVSGGEGPNA